MTIINNGRSVIGIAYRNDRKCIAVGVGIVCQYINRNGCILIGRSLIVSRNRIRIGLAGWQTKLHSQKWWRLTFGRIEINSVRAARNQSPAEIRIRICSPTGQTGRDIDILGTSRQFTRSDVRVLGGFGAIGLNSFGEGIPGVGVIPTIQHTMKRQRSAAIGHLHCQIRRQDRRTTANLSSSIAKHIFKSQQSLNSFAAVFAIDVDRRFLRVVRVRSGTGNKSI